MNSTEIRGRWGEMKGKLKQQFATLTDNDLMYEEGKEEELLSRLQKKLGRSKEEVNDIISRL